ncbi:MAG: hypothetical protein V3R68_05395, partial [Gammaproteobacteria bacterium]
TSYVDVISSLQQEALKPIALYPDSDNGHPIAAGYRVIGTTVAQAVGHRFQHLTDGLSLGVTINNIQTLLFIEKGNYWIVYDPEDLALAMHPENFQILQTSRLAGLNFRGHINIREIMSTHQP